MESALLRLGELAATEGEHVELLLLGGGAMVLRFDARSATRDVDAVILAPPDRAAVRRWAAVVAEERGWSPDWLNEGAKSYLVAAGVGETLISAAGLTVRLPTIEQLLAMKLCAWRDDLDVSDAKRLLIELAGDHDAVWSRVETHLQPGRELKAKYAFEDLWESLHDTA